MEHSPLRPYGPSFMHNGKEYVSHILAQSPDAAADQLSNMKQAALVDELIKDVSDYFESKSACAFCLGVTGFTISTIVKAFVAGHTK